MFFLRGIIEVSSQATETARSILLMREAHREAVTAQLARSAANGHRMLEHLYLHPAVSVSSVKDLLGITYPAASNLVKKFVELGILREITGHRRNRLFRYEPYIRLFNEA